MIFYCTSVGKFNILVGKTNLQGLEKLVPASSWLRENNMKTVMCNCAFILILFKLLMVVAAREKYKALNE